MSSQGMTTHFRYTREHSPELTGSWFLPAALLTHSLLTRPGTWRAWALDTGHLFHSTNWELSSCSGFEVQLLPGVSEKQTDTKDTGGAVLRSLWVHSALLQRDLASCSLLYHVFLSLSSTRVLTSPTESQLTCPPFLFLLCFFFFFSFDVPLRYCVSKGTPQLAHGQPASVQRHSCAALVQGDKLQEYLPFERAASASTGLIRARLNLITHLLSDLQDTSALHFPDWWRDDSI